MNSAKDETTVSDVPERRASPRCIAVDFVWYKVVTPGTNMDSSEEGISKMSDISDTGVGLYMTKPIKVDTLVFIEICSRPFRLSALGEVVNNRKSKKGYFRIGIRFCIMPPNDRMTLMAFWKKNEKA